MILVYSDSQILDLEWIQKIQFPDDIEICHSFVDYMASASTTKIAFTTHRLHCDYDTTCSAYQGFEDKIIQLSAASQLVFTFESELHNFHWQIWEKCHRDNVYWLLPGMVNDREDINSHILYWGDWFKTTSLLYKELPHKLAELKPYETKPFVFDALLGVIKPHRDFVYSTVKFNKLEDKFIMTYGGRWNHTEFYAKDYFIWEPDCIPTGKVIGTADAVHYCGIYTGLSRVIPLQVYNDTAYSIITETDHDNTLSFFSEKTAKPLLARRLFVAFSGYKFLQNLRSIGFQTFGDVIDESYDLIKDDHARYLAAFEQVKYLCIVDQVGVLEKIKPALEHNYNLIMQSDWTGLACDKISNAIATQNL